MKIVHTAGSLESEASGPTYSVPATVNSLQKLGHDVHLMSIGPKRQDVQNSYTHHRFKNAIPHLPGLRALSIAPKMKTALKAMNADIIHTQGLWLMPNIYPAQVAAQQNKPFIITTRGMLAPAALAYSHRKKSLFSSAFQQQALKQANLFHATSQQEYLDIRRYGMTQPVLITPNGIDLPELQSKPRSELKKLLFFGRLHPIKGLENLINAWSRIEADFPDWHLELRGMGDANYITNLNQKIQNLNLRRAVIGSGVFGSDKTALYQSAHLYILPSESENFAITVAECLACETPVICTRGAPWSGLVTHNAGWWVNQDTASLEICLRDALKTPNHKLEKMGQNGRLWMQKEFTWQSVAKQLETAYAWLLNDGERPSNIIIE